MYSDEPNLETEYDSYESLIKALVFIRSHLKIVAIVVVIALLSVIYAYRLIQSKLCVPAADSSSSVGERSVAESMLVVDVSGAVTNPGVFELPFDSRIADAIALAGPITNTASVTWVSQIINFAQPLQDGQKIYIPFEHDLTNNNLQEVLIALKDTYQTTASPMASQPAPATDDAGALINVNTASQAQLNELPGIGDAYAEKIIASRPYKDIAELTSKTKLSVKTVDKFRNLISF